MRSSHPRRIKTSILSSITRALKTRQVEFIADEWFGETAAVLDDCSFAYKIGEHRTGECHALATFAATDAPRRLAQKDNAGLSCADSAEESGSIYDARRRY